MILPMMVMKCSPPREGKVGVAARRSEADVSCIETGEGPGQRTQNICSSRRHLSVRHNVPSEDDDAECSGGGYSFGR